MKTMVILFCVVITATLVGCGGEKESSSPNSLESLSTGIDGARDTANTVIEESAESAQDVTENAPESASAETDKTVDAVSEALSKEEPNKSGLQEIVEKVVDAVSDSDAIPDAELPSTELPEADLPSADELKNLKKPKLPN